MNFIQSLLHYGSYALAFYALYFVATTAVVAVYLWQRVYRKPARLVTRSVRHDLRGGDSHLR